MAMPSFGVRRAANDDPLWQLLFRRQYFALPPSHSGRRSACRVGRGVEERFVIRHFIQQ